MKNKLTSQDTVTQQLPSIVSENSLLGNANSKNKLKNEKYNMQGNFKGQDEQIEICTKSGYIIKISHNLLGHDKISITCNNQQENKIFAEIIPYSNKIDISTNMDLNINAHNIKIKAEKEIEISSGDDTIIKGSTIRLN